MDECPKYKSHKAIFFPVKKERFLAPYIFKFPLDGGNSPAFEILYNLKPVFFLEFYYGAVIGISAFW